MAYFRVTYIDKRGGGNMIGAKDLVDCATILEGLFNRRIEAKARDNRDFVVGRVWKEGIKFNWFCEKEGE